MYLHILSSTSAPPPGIQNERSLMRNYARDNSACAESDVIFSPTLNDQSTQ